MSSDQPRPLRNFRLRLQYDGTRFSGWQTQPQKRTVQQTIEEILSNLTQEKIHLIGASRTDAGVHAQGQIASFRTHSRLPAEKFFTALSGLLPEDISVIEIDEMTLDFHAIRSAQKKTYRYLLLSSPRAHPLLGTHAWHVWENLDLEAMRKAASFLVGEHDFSAFRGAKSGTKTSVRRIHRIEIKAHPAAKVFPLLVSASKIRSQKNPARILCLDIDGNGFLKYMVRNIVGTLVHIGKGRLPPRAIKEILSSQNRRNAGPTAPAKGLYLWKIQWKAEEGGTL